MTSPWISRPSFAWPKFFWFFLSSFRLWYFLFWSALHVLEQSVFSLFLFFSFTDPTPSWPTLKAPESLTGNRLVPGISFLISDLNGAGDGAWSRYTSQWSWISLMTYCLNISLLIPLYIPRICAVHRCSIWLGRSWYSLICDPMPLNLPHIVYIVRQIISNIKFIVF